MKKILVTGGLGYIGGRIIIHLLKSGNYEIYVTTRKKNVTSTKLFPGYEDVKFIDTADFEGNNYAFPVYFDCIIHLAAYNEIDSEINPIGAAQYNIISSLKLLQEAVKNKTKQFIYFSTAHVYGSPLEGDINEEKLTRPIHPYAISHKAFEDFVLASRDKGQIDGIVLRLSNSFGAPVWPNVDRWSLLVNDLCKQVFTTGVLQLNSTGRQQRDFITLTNVASAVEFLLHTSKDKTGNGLFNLSGSNTLTVLEMTQIIVQRCKQIFQKEIPVFLPIKQDVAEKKHKHLNLSNKKFEDLGFKFQSNNVEEIDNLLFFCKKHF